VNPVGDRAISILRHVGALRVARGSGHPYLRGHGAAELLSLLGCLPSGERIGQVLAATEKAACLRAIHKFGISREAQKDLQVRPS
jgi:hypothetical protein